MKKISLKIILPFLAVSAALTSCKKSYLDRRPSDQIVLDSVFKTTASARGAIQGLNGLMFAPNGNGDHHIFGQKTIDLMADLMGEDMPISGFGAGWFYGAYSYQDAQRGTSTAAYTWTYYFRIVNNANQIIANIDGAQGPQSEKDYIKGQALFYRAFAYYNLSIYFQDSYPMVKKAGGLDDTSRYSCVPIYTAPTQTGTYRHSVGDVYKQIDSDLNTAIPLLASGSRSSKTEVNQTVAKGLKARVALMKEDWATAAQNAADARQGFPLMAAQDVLTGFNDINNSEWIWGSVISIEQTGIFESFLSQMDVDMNGYASLGMQKCVLNTLYGSIKATDARKKWWYSPQEARGTVYFAYGQRKFRRKLAGSWAADVSYMRAAEMLLIEAEAQQMLGNETKAKDLLEELGEHRDTAYVRSTNTGAALLTEIRNQRRIELWGEGFRFSDIRRQILGLTRQGTNHDDALYGETGSLPSDDPSFRFKIVQTELDANKLIKQNY